MRAAAPGGFLVLPWPGSGMAPGPEEEGGGLLARCGALLGVTLFCKNQLPTVVTVMSDSVVRL